MSFAFAVNFETKLETFSLNNYTCCSVESDKRKSPIGRNFERGHRIFFSFFPLSVRMSSSSPVIYPIFYFLMAIEYLALATPLGQHKGEVFSVGRPSTDWRICVRADELEELISSPSAASVALI